MFYPLSWLRVIEGYTCVKIYRAAHLIFMYFIEFIMIKKSKEQKGVFFPHMKTSGNILNRLNKLEMIKNLLSKHRRDKFKRL